MFLFGITALVSCQSVSYSKMKIQKGAERMEYIHVPGMPTDGVLADIAGLYRTIFQTEEDLTKDLETKRNLVTFAALANDQVVGFKMGYDRKEGHFYSWLGGVEKGFREQGIASELIRRQHSWCRQNGYRTIRTHTKNKWKDMLILNLRHGFDVIGTYTDDKGEPKIILERVVK
ncbi:MAG TPA: GNAT family N-acetyltransferase [Bacillales bacterium]|nr:GNAT family N-acetyltransferase [Bacillales bacterium]